MKKISIFGIMLLHTWFISCTNAQMNGENKNSLTQKTKNVSADEFKKLITEEGTILDIRTPEEYKNGHLKNSVHVNFYANDFLDVVEEKVDKSKPVYIYCAGGGRSARAMKKMESKGYKIIYNLNVGYNGWKEKGFPTVK